MSETLIGGMVVVIMAICESVKYTGVDTRWIPLLAIILGVVGSLLLGGVEWVNVSVGVVTGLVSSGLYSVYKRTIINK